MIRTGILALCLGVASTATAQEAPSAPPASPSISPRGVVDARYLDIERIIQGSDGVRAIRDRISTLMEVFVDFQELSRLTIKRTWPTLKPSQRKEFVSLFKQLIQRTYARRFEPDHKLGVVFQGPAELRKGRARVRTTVTSGGTTADVEYRMHVPEGQENWWAYDIVIDDVSMMRNYRTQFHRILQDGGVEALLARLREKAEKKEL